MPIGLANPHDSSLTGRRPPHPKHIAQWDAENRTFLHGSPLTISRRMQYAPVLRAKRVVGPLRREIVDGRWGDSETVQSGQKAASEAPLFPRTLNPSATAASTPLCHTTFTRPGTGTARRDSRHAVRNPSNRGIPLQERRSPMPRYALALIAVVTLAAPQAFGQAIQFEGSVQPASPSGFPVVGGSDSNGDGVTDFLSTGGNGIITTGISQTDPTGLSGNGLPWNAQRIYRNYDTAQNILVGDQQQSGRLAISAGGTLRYQHLVLGGVSELTNSTSTLNFEIEEEDDFTVSNYLSAVGPGTGGSGVMTVSGFGSLFSNDPNLIDQNVQTAINLARGNATNAFDVITDISGGNLDDSFWPFAGNFSTREDLVGYDVVVGLNGTGALSVTAGGRVEVQDALMVGVDTQSNGTVVVDGAGSQLFAYGRTQLDEVGNTLTSTPSNETASFIGGRGNGSLAVSDGGRAEFLNGLSIGAPTGQVLAASNNAADLGRGSGTVTVTGSGSLLNTYASFVSDGADDFDNHALTIGEIRTGTLSDSSFDPTDPANANLQAGTLAINLGAIVTTAANNGNDADAAIGKRGQVDLGGGQLQVSDNLDSDGVISGYGTVRANTMETSAFSVVRGGNPGSENAELAEPLRLLVLANTNPEDVDGAAFRNRGLVEGRVNFDISGTIVNEGQIETSGEIFANKLFTSVESRIRQAPGTDSPLRLRLNDNTQAGDANGGGGANNFGALHNRGSIEGEVDFIVTGGVVNGDNNLPFGTTPPLPSSGSASTGSISGSGRILAGTFINHDDAEVRVGAGESLSILANSENETEFDAGNGIPVVGAGGVGYRTMNLGSMSVDGGSLEIGYLNDTSPSAVSFTAGPGAFNTNEIFFNARYVVETGGLLVERTVGTITVNDGDLRLTTGMINAGVLAFTGGDNLVHGKIYNTSLDYNSGSGPFPESGAIIVSGSGTTVTFEDNVINDGIISIGPFDNVVNFLGDLDLTGPSGTGQVQLTIDAFGNNESAFIQVAGDVTINGGNLSIGSLVAPSTTTTPNVSIALIVADNLAEESLFTELQLPNLPDGQFWDIVYDTDSDEVRLEIVESNAFGADFNGDGIVSQNDVDVWIRNAGITMGASTIQGDADLDGDVDLADYDVLMAQLFTGIPELVNSGIAFVNGAVPEPTTALLLCLAAVSVGATRRR